MDKQKGLAPIVIILILVAILGGGVLIWQQGWQSKEEVKSPKEAAETLGETTQNGTVNRKIYTDTDYKFQIKYPSDWLRKVGTNETLSSGAVTYRLRLEKGSDNLIQVAIFDSKGLSLKQWFLQQETLDQKMPATAEDIVVNGISGIRYDMSQAIPSRYFITAYFKNDDKIYSIQFVAKENEEILETFNQILSTFKFLD